MTLRSYIQKHYTACVVAAVTLDVFVVIGAGYLLFVVA
jgi:hypothetical protein